MATIKFSDWVALREQAPASAAAASPIDSEIKQTVASTAGKSEQERKKAMDALIRKKQTDPRVKPKDLQKIADSFPGAGEDEKTA